MARLYRVATPRLHHSDPLHWAHFYGDKQRIHRSVMERRQDLISYLANVHANVSRSKLPRQLVSVPMSLTALRKWDYDYRKPFDHFFEIVQLGYFVDEDLHELTIVRPRQLDEQTCRAVKTAATLRYDPGPRVETETCSKVQVQQQRREEILQWLVDNQKHHLRTPVEWLLEQPEVNFYFERAGKLKLRDTSVWPIAGIETWPSALRKLLFGDGIDIDAAYTQFMVERLVAEHETTPQRLEMLYPDVLRSLHDKKAWREELCVETLGLPINSDNIGVVKRLCMSLANGSRISPAILTGGRAFSVTAEIVIASVDDVSPSRLIRIGKRLQSISHQYARARRAIAGGGRSSHKRIFVDYFAWEREARYRIWKAIDQHGIMVHDGIDGVPPEYLKNLPSLMQEVGVALS